jgi:hypothetical protein
MRGAIVLLTAAFAVAACSGKGSTGSTANSAPSVSASTSAALVTGRASTPTDVKAPGIQVPAVNAQFSVQVGSHEIVVTGNDWDTIVAASKVEPNVGVGFVSGFNWNATTRNRFQYLADLIASDKSSHDFDPITVATGFKNGNVISIVALYNAGDQAGNLTGLKLTVISGPMRTLVGSAEFFATTDSSLMIPAKTIIFARLYCPVTTQPKAVNGVWEITNNFHWDSFAPA